MFKHKKNLILGFAVIISIFVFNMIAVIVRSRLINKLSFEKNAVDNDHLAQASGYSSNTQLIDSINQLEIVQACLLSVGALVSLYMLFAGYHLFTQILGEEPKKIRHLSRRIVRGQLSETQPDHAASGIYLDLLALESSLKAVNAQAVMLASGNTDTNITLRSEQDNLGKNFLRLSNSLKQVVNTVNAVAQGDFAIRIPEQDEHDLLARSINQMIANLQASITANQKTQWVQTGQVKIAESLRSETDFSVLAATLLKTLAEYTHAQCGSLYHRTEADQETLSLVAGYAYPFEQNRRRSVELGETLIGEAGRDTEIKVVNNIPDGHFTIQSALGDIKPKHLVFIPFHFLGEIRGVIELGYIKDVSSEILELFSSTKENIGLSFEATAAQIHIEKQLQKTRRLAEQLKNNEKRIRTIIELSLASIITISKEGIILSCNKSTETMFGYQPSEMIGRNVKMLMPNNIAREHDGYLRDYQKTGIAKIIGIGREVVAQRKDGSQFHIHLSVAEMNLDDQSGYLGTISDISEQVEQRERLNQSYQELQASSEELAAQKEDLRLANEKLNKHTEDLNRQTEELKQAYRYKSEFLANMSHELRTPLNSLLILSKMLTDNEEGNLTSDQTESAEIIHESGSHLLELINDILDLSKLEAGQMKIHRDTFSLTDLKLFLNNRFQHMATDKGIVFEILIKAEAPKQFCSDYAKLGQILTNLIGNAIKFTETGRVRLTISQLSEQTILPQHSQLLALEVSDTGIGIPEHKIDAIFEAFQQVDGSSNRKYSGTGLGLSIALNFARLLSGDIKLKSTEGKGSQFILYIPDLSDSAEIKTESDQIHNALVKPLSLSAFDAELPPPFEDDRHRYSDHQALLLIIEDDIPFARIIYNTCRQLNVQAIVATDGESGLYLAQHYPLTGIILDHDLPGMDGSDVLAVLQSDSKTQRIPVHVVSAIHNLIDMKQLGAIGQVSKPVDFKQLESVINKLLDSEQKTQHTILLIEDDSNNAQAIQKLLEKEALSIDCAHSAEQALAALQQQSYTAVIMDLGLPQMNGFELLEQLCETTNQSPPPIIVYTAKDLSDEEHLKLQNLTQAIVIKSEKSADRLLDEIRLFIAHLNDDQDKLITPTRLDKLIDKTVLLVDDDMRNTFSLAKILRKKQLTVHIAPSGQTALDLLEKHPETDIVLMDIMMPEMDGYETIKRIRSQLGLTELPIIALTAKAMQGDKEKCLAAGANDYLAKPVDVDQLLLQMQIWLPNTLSDAAPHG